MYCLPQLQRALVGVLLLQIVEGVIVDSGPHIGVPEAPFPLTFAFYLPQLPWDHLIQHRSIVFFAISLMSACIHYYPFREGKMSKFKLVITLCRRILITNAG